MRELLLEIWTSVRRNKLRTFLTGFSVAWGIFMLVILLGSGNGLKNGVLSNFGNYATNSITISGGWTSKAYAGYNKWRSIDLKNRDLEILVNEFPEVDDVAAKAWYRGSTATYLDRFADISLRGSLPKIQQIEGVEIVKGRFINQADIHNYRKVIVIDEALERILFRGDDPLGKPVKIHNNIYRVAGVYRGDAQQRNSMGYIPLTTGQLIFKANDPSWTTRSSPYTDSTPTRRWRPSNSASANGWPPNTTTIPKTRAPCGYATRWSSTRA